MKFFIIRKWSVYACILYTLVYLAKVYLFSPLFLRTHICKNMWDSRFLLHEGISFGYLSGTIIKPPLEHSKDLRVLFNDKTILPSIVTFSIWEIIFYCLKLPYKVHKWKDSSVSKLLLSGVVKFHSEYCLLFIDTLWDQKVQKNF